MLTTELAAGEQLRTIPGENVTRMKIELALADADTYAPETLARIRENLGTDLVVFGSYVTVGDGDAPTLRVDIRLQDSREGADAVASSARRGRAASCWTSCRAPACRLREQLGVHVAPCRRCWQSVRASQPAVAGRRAALRRRLDAAAPVRRAWRARPFGAGRPGRPAFPLAHSALARTWSTLGYDARARETPRARVRAVCRTLLARGSPAGRGHVSRDGERVEGSHRDLADAVDFFPDDVEHALRLANAQISSGAAKDGLATIEGFRKRFP